MSRPSSPPSRVIHLHVDAPPKPAEGAPCNGCGLCCAAEPCPVGVLVSRKRVGACHALQWSDSDGRYVCGLVSDPARVLRWLPPALAPLLSRLARRWIASATGCDASLVAETA
ncbi:hypothetical protein [Ideonella sp.]|uniref:hypothetical protein n=1 Tax=Ideonella sp. TaxID=1929293 RepID=UPI0035ADDFDB